MRMCQCGRKITGRGTKRNSKLCARCQANLAKGLGAIARQLDKKDGSR